jgi:hypothetical protein
MMGGLPWRNKRFYTRDKDIVAHLFRSHPYGSRLGTLTEEEWMEESTPRLLPKSPALVEKWMGNVDNDPRDAHAQTQTGIQEMRTRQTDKINVGSINE